MTIMLWIVALAMTATALWRLPALRYGDPTQRALWVCAAGFAAAVWCRVPQVKHALDNSAVTDLSALAKYLTSLVAILAALRYVTAVYGEPSGDSDRHIAVSQRISHVAHTCAAVAMTAQVVLFFTVVDRSHPTVDFASAQEGQWGGALFLTIQYSYLGVAAATCCYQWARAARRAETRTMGIGLALMAAAAGLYTIYPVFRTVTTWTSPEVSDITMRTVADSVTMTVACLWAAGAAVPTTMAISARWNARRALRRLHPLWSELMNSFPHLAPQQPGAEVSESLRFAPSLDIRLDRRTREIAEGLEQLRHHATSELLPVAEDLAEAHHDPEAAAEAYWIRAAQQSLKSGKRSAVPSRRLREKPLTSAVAEASWLARVAAVPVSDGLVQLLHQRAGEPPIAPAFQAGGTGRATTRT
ncbi:MAB_1171c family putative transporter [Streptomyces sp. NBRC 110465]|uniref:MAB_1171c family putative transporter n=1 Tax=Streptomyces sp. NBRC 110465 TaxID=1897621 RepID=UPI000933D501|nr:MAB_1171c family putative transporter [Streptomyces sp. NBRC 110465]